MSPAFEVAVVGGRVTITFGGQCGSLDLQDAEHHAHAILDACEQVREQARMDATYSGRTLSLPFRPTTRSIDVVAFKQVIEGVVGRAWRMSTDDAREIQLILAHLRRSPWGQGCVQATWDDGSPAL